MRLWSLHPKYLDRQGILAVWREGLLAQSVLQKGQYSLCPKCQDSLGKKYFKPKKSLIGLRIPCDKCKQTGRIKTPYWNHPQLNRFKNNIPLKLIGYYLSYIYLESLNRKYNFNKYNIKHFYYSSCELVVTKDQLKYERNLLIKKLIKRNGYFKAPIKLIPHPLFKAIKGDIEPWEKIK